jgi:hypothetical protein
MKNSHGILRGMEWIMFHGLPNFALDLPQRDGSEGHFTPRGQADFPWDWLHEISVFFGLEAGHNYTL